MIRVTTALGAILAAMLPTIAPAAPASAPAPTANPAPASATTQTEGTHAAKTARNRAVMADFVDLFYRQRRVVDAFQAHVAAGYIQHNPDVPDGRDVATGMLSHLFGIPGGRFDVQRVIVDGDMAAVHLRGAPDPARPAVAVVDLYRLKDGLIVEHWDVVQPIPPATKNPHPFF